MQTTLRKYLKSSVSNADRIPTSNLYHLKLFIASMVATLLRVTESSSSSTTTGTQPLSLAMRKRHLLVGPHRSPSTKPPRFSMVWNHAFRAKSKANLSLAHALSEAVSRPITFSLRPMAQVSNALK